MSLQHVISHTLNRSSTALQTGLGLRLWLGLDYQWSNACPGLPQKIGVWLLGVACSLVAGVLAVQARGPAITSPSASHMRARAHTHHTHSRPGG